MYKEGFLLPIWYFCIQLVVLAAVAAVSIFLAMGKGNIDALQAKVRMKTAALSLLCADVDAIKSEAEQLAPEVQRSVEKNLQEVYEAIRYSDPMSSDKLQECEEEIRGAVALLGSEVAELAKTKGDDPAQIHERCGEILRRVKDRNNRVKILK